MLLNRTRCLAALVIVASGLSGEASHAIPIIDEGVLNVGDELRSSGVFSRGGSFAFGLQFELLTAVDAGSGLSLTVDSFGSAVDTEMAFYSVDTGNLIHMNDDGPILQGGFDPGLDSYYAFGDADMGDGSEFRGFTRQERDGGDEFIVSTDIGPGTYLVIIAPYNAYWDEFDFEQSELVYDGSTAGWECNISFVPAPASLALFAMGGCVAMRRRRRL